MPVDFLSDDQVSRYGRFASEPTPGELEQFFRLDAKGRELVAGKRRDATKLGFAVQWGTVRMLGAFLVDDPVAVPRSTVAFVAEQLGLDPACLNGYTSRAKTAYEHTWEIRDTYGYREFSAAEGEVRTFLAARVWAFSQPVLDLRVNALVTPAVLGEPVLDLLRSPDGRRKPQPHPPPPHPPTPDLTPDPEPSLPHAALDHVSEIPGVLSPSSAQ